MFLKISDVIYILDFFSDFKEIEKKILLIQLSKLRFNRQINWNRIYELGLHLNLIKENNGQVKITSSGNLFYSMYDGQNLNNSQKFFIFKNGIFKNKFFTKINSFLNLFSLNEFYIFELYKTENKFEKNKLNLEDQLILYELNIITNYDDKFSVNEPFSEILFQSAFFGKDTLTQSELDQILKEQREIGDLAEKLSLKYEKNEFIKKKWNYQAQNVRIIGKKNVKAGYDIESFLTKNSKLNSNMFSDKHIEVKGRKYGDFSFMISVNELKVGKILSEKKNESYLIYFWNNLGSKNLPTSPTKILSFKDLKVKTCENCLNYLVNV